MASQKHCPTVIACHRGLLRVWRIIWIFISFFWNQQSTAMIHGGYCRPGYTILRLKGSCIFAFQYSHLRIDKNLFLSKILVNKGYTCVKKNTKTYCVCPIGMPDSENCFQVIAAVDASSWNYGWWCILLSLSAFVITQWCCVIWSVWSIENHDVQQKQKAMGFACPECGTRITNYPHPPSQTGLFWSI